MAGACAPALAGAVFPARLGGGVGRHVDRARSAGRSTDVGRPVEATGPAGQTAFAAEDHERASELFEDPAWRAAAQYRDGQYEPSAETLATAQTADGHYNRGNALARAGSIAEAIEAYDQALEIDPEHEDARFNRDLLMQQPPQQSRSDSGEEGESGDGSESRQSAQSQESDQSDSSPGEESESRGADEGEEQAQQQSATAAPQDEPPEGEPVPTPGDLEEWASEQAAEQWLRRIPEDPGGLLRRKFLYQYQRLGVDQDGNYVWPGDEEQPW